MLVSSVYMKLVKLKQKFEVDLGNLSRSHFKLKKSKNRTGEMGHCLRVYTNFAQDGSLGHSTFISWLKSTYNCSCSSCTLM